MNKAKLIIISAPSGCGKTTIVECLLQRNKNLTRSISYTTRPPRPGEVNGRDYFFISRKEFAARKRKGFFLESARVFGHSYGTSQRFVKRCLAKGVSVVFAIDVQGMKQLSRKLNRKLAMTSIFIMPPSLASLRARLEKRRTETKAEIGKRFRVAEAEMAERSLYDFVVVNRKVKEAVQTIEEILE